jgi:hypothetical protein
MILVRVVRSLVAHTHTHTKQGNAAEMTESIGLLDDVSATLTSEKHFPSRVTVKDASARKMPALARNLYRVFSYAHDKHHDIFLAFEAQTALCKRFVSFAEKYEFMDPVDLSIPLA